MSVLDDIKMIHQRDKSDALGIAEKQWQQVIHEFSVDTSSVDFDAVEHIVFAGMGGSALAAVLFQSWPAKTVPFEVVRSYDLPNYADEKTLVIAGSYSGNTEETLSVVAQAQDKGCQIIAISSGGVLADLANKHGYPLYQLPGGFQPRMATLYGFNALVTMLGDTSVIESKDSLSELRKVGDKLQQATAKLRPDVPTNDNLAKKLALDIAGSSMVIYAGPLLFPAAYKWKISFNENAKNVAWCNQYPEFNHNEFLGWTSHPVQKPYKVINLQSSFEHEQVNKRFEISERLLSGKKPAGEMIQAEGDSLLEQLLWTVQLGDFVSLYTALLNGLDPTPVDIIEKLKQELKN